MAFIPKNPPTEIKPLDVDEIVSKILRPSLTSQYIVNITPPKTEFLSSRVDVKDTRRIYDNLHIGCVEASLPGSSLATLDIDNDYAGISEKHGYRRIYDDRIDFTFFVDAEEYYSIRFFEAWIAYVVNEQRDGFDLPNYTYRVNFPGKSVKSKDPGGYYAEDLSITKFEKDFSIPALGAGTGNFLTYKFINAFPISIGSMPVSYEQSTLLKCTVSFSYSRYRIDEGYQQVEQLVNQNTSGNVLPNTSQVARPTAPTAPNLQQQIRNRRLGL